MIPDPEVGPKMEKEEKGKLNQLKKILSEDEKKTIVQEAYKLKQH